jgi:hypothetical protein
MVKDAAFKSGLGRCIFCTRQPPDIVMSREHVFPDWLRQIFPRTAGTTHTLGVMEWAGAPGRSPAKQTRKQRPGHSGTKKIRRVCKTCNETWLSNIEKIAKPILAPLINGEKIELDATKQRILATWAAKTVMTAEQIHPNKVVVYQAERTWLKENLTPPAGWNVWAGTYNGFAWGELAIQQYAGLLRIPTVDNGNPAEHNLIFTIFGMRRLMLVVTSSTWPRMWEIMESVGSPSGLSLSRIWPVVQASISWPRAFVLTDADGDQMADAYRSRIWAQPIKR